MIPVDPSTRTFYIAGVKFRTGYERFRDVNPDLPIAVPLIGEPKNQYDRYAIRVEFADPSGNRHVLGYVPKPMNINFWALRDAGYRPEAKIIRYKENGPTHEMFLVEVAFTKSS